MADLIRTLIVDDEAEAREGLKLLLSQDRDIELCAMCKNGLEAIQAILQHRPQLLFLDIQMPQINGFEVLYSLPKDQLPATVFVTAYDQYALQAFEVHAIDYLLKPFSDERFVECLAHAKQHLSQKEAPTDPGKLVKLLDTYFQQKEEDKHEKLIPSEGANILDRLVVKSGSKIHILDHQDIIWIEADDYYVKIHLEGRFFLVRESLKNLSQKLPSHIFCRIHRSHLINLTYIQDLEPFHNGEYIVRLKTGQKLKLSRSFRDHLLGKLNL